MTRIALPCEGRMLFQAERLVGAAEMPPTPRAKARLAGNSKRLLTMAMADASTQFVRPSLLAAAALAVDRKARGLVPVWPASLRRWTGIAGPEDPALAAAMQVWENTQKPKPLNLEPVNPKP